MRSIDEQLFIWKVDGQPDVGTMRGYASLWKHRYYGADIKLSDTVMTWDDDEDAITYDVRCQRMGTDGDGNVRYEFSVTGFSGREVVLINGWA